MLLLPSIKYRKIRKTLFKKIKKINHPNKHGSKLRTPNFYGMYLSKQTSLASISSEQMRETVHVSFCLE